MTPAAAETAEVPRTAVLGEVELAPAVSVTLERRVRPPEVPAWAKREAAVYVQEERSAAAAVLAPVPATLAVGCR